MTTFTAGLPSIGVWWSALPANSPAYRGNGLLATARSRRTANWASDTSRRLPGAARAASPRRSAPEAILEQCLDNGRAGTERGGKMGPQAGVKVQFTARPCVPMARDGSEVIKGRPRSKTPSESLRWPASGDHVALDDFPHRPKPGVGWDGWKYQEPGSTSAMPCPASDSGARIESDGLMSAGSKGAGTTAIRS